MKLYQSLITLPGAPVGAENPLPMLRDLPWDRALADGGLTQGEQAGFGFGTGRRLLPYKAQDGYNREKRPMDLKTVVMENQKLKATFLPEYGGRLYSLYDKERQRELLSVNPVFQPCNLAVRNAWFSGGIEWNLGQYGHSGLTCEPLFFARCKTEEGQEFLRVYEYERIKCMFLQMDFHLPEDSNVLYAHVTLHNTFDQPTSLYWWTNTAVPMDKRVRVLSGTAQVISNLPNGGRFDTFTHEALPILASIPHMDASYPGDYPFSVEYFFQNEPVCHQAWEAAAYDDGSAFFERSTPQMPFRKMFCWSGKEGGQHWQEFLSTPHCVPYLEIQSGLYPTQIHGGELGPLSRVCFTQAFGGMDTDAAKTHGKNWEEAAQYAYARLDGIISAEEITARHSQFEKSNALEPLEILHTGSGWGALEGLKDCARVPKGLVFPQSTLGKEQAPWVSLLNNHRLPQWDESQMPPSYLCDHRWLSLIKQSVEECPTPQSLFHYGLACYETGAGELALRALSQAAETSPSPVIPYALAMVYKQLGQLDKALPLSEKAAQTCRPEQLTAFARSHLSLLVEAGQYERAWAFYAALPEDARSDGAMKLQAAVAAYETGHTQFLESQFYVQSPTLREGEARITELWFRVQAQKMTEQDPSLTPDSAYDKALSTLSPPREIEFRTYTKY